MRNDAFTNELYADTPSAGARPDSQTRPYAKLINEYFYDLASQHASQLEDYVQIIDNIVRTSGSGSHYSRMQDVFYGLNRLAQVPELPVHMESQGILLLTRPDLNLTYNNIGRVRQLTHLLDQNLRSVPNAVKLSLDMRTQRSNNLVSPLVDLNNPYLALLSNAAITMSPPPDLGINLYQSPEGRFREQFMMNDSIAENHSYYDLTMTFSNIKGNAVVLTFLTWLQYMGFLRVGPIKPHPENLIRNRMDYNTRIERYKMDVTGRYVEQWFHTGASVPKNISIGASFALNRLEPMEMENKEISVQFGCVGAVYNDPIQLWELNARMIRYHPGLRDDRRKRLFYKVPFEDHSLTNMHGYPLINLLTRELEWWVPKEEYRNLLIGVYDVQDRVDYLEAETQKIPNRYTPMSASQLTP